ncbi:MAG: 2-oxoacid:ferredoxin oxidoreductase subunit beta [Candidatus Nanoarchaeia archaeon]|nr:2-oxoacid:ferredoxin oxidoreductase subunit beta [Candidatus Nanoarchaeia archaeon]
MFETQQNPNWCPGCGNYGIWNSLKLALQELNLKPENIAFTSGIGCSGKIPHWIRAYCLNGLHGRALPLAEGIKIANSELIVIACGGDGDGYAEGTNHFIHFCRRNANVKYFVHDNQIYGLTKGQPSPTSNEGFITKTTPLGTIEKALNPVLIAIASGATFVARGFAGDIPHLKELMKKAIKHNGAAVIDILQPCVTFNKVNTYEWYQKRAHKLKKPANTRIKAMRIAEQWGKKIPIGVIFESNEKSYEQRIPLLKKSPLMKLNPKKNIKKLFNELK